MDKRQISSVIIVALAITFIGASVASSKIKTLKKIKAGSITNPYIADGAVNSAKIQDGTVSNADYSDNSVTTGKIADGEVSTDDLANNAVTTGKISDGTIAAGDLADSSVTSAKISDGAIVNTDINSSAAIAGTKISPNFGSQDVTTTEDVNATNGAGNFLRVTVGDTLAGTGGGLYVDDELTANGLQINPSDASTGDADSATTPTDETCNSNNWGTYEFVDDTDSPAGWLWICQRSGPDTYAWVRVSGP
ncbi:MAG: hypothetical protein A2374_01580 [Candidatus Moranbacteria bacterium RIFOXYB1_FULL_44_23]|nr:MAG: hypothetical protein A2407_02340 [Candidatus Moranbacteria bacterium RIFOXYC1_FULL_44_8]OGI39381.1 MAG: hypothetical protein A2374_01580 [Candidatus Moranbacteria bacterium RIFOXYB1_FULL_44_23]OGI41416.1 MAG: hypothetical protein A2593_04005 [Candidatus Moranbacteria bacterium RIFOXYD1_FULL_44_9]HBB37174.1 hypothetical protein [Candidatus Moranbacteria bacterium]HBU24807.1 hypothetical protein [Candidatus Moranbacteria bacterium]